MGSRLKLQAELENILGSRNVYFQPPESIKLHYPAIIYSIKSIGNLRANNTVYKKNDAYELIYIDEDPDNENIDKLRQIPYCSFDRFFEVDNLNHYTFTLYY